MIYSARVYSVNNDGGIRMLKLIVCTQALPPPAEG